MSQELSDILNPFSSFRKAMEIPREEYEHDLLKPAVALTVFTGHLMAVYGLPLWGLYEIGKSLLQ